MSAAYEVREYDCDIRPQRAILGNLTKKAEKQQATGDSPPFDPRVQPWIHGCFQEHKSIEKIRNYVAEKRDGTIVGWLLAETRKRFNRTYVYLHEISVTRVKSDEHRGIGRALHAALLQTAARDGAQFIYLYPLTVEAAASYHAWGYRTPHELGYGYESMKHQFIVLRDPPASDKNPVIPTRLLDKLKDPDPRRLFVEANALAARLAKEGFPDLTERFISRNAPDDPTFVARLRDALDTIAVFTDGAEGEALMEDAEQYAYLRDLVETEEEVNDRAKALFRGGRRRTRKHKRRGRKTRRSLK